MRLSDCVSISSAIVNPSSVINVLASIFKIDSMRPSGAYVHQ